MKRLTTVITILLLILLLMVSVAGCSDHPKTYSGHGVSFNYPWGWFSVDVSDSEALGVVAFQRRGTDIEPGVIVEACSLEGMTLRQCEQAHTFAFTNTEYTNR